MTVVLVIFATLNGQPLEPAAVGLMASPEACHVAGTGMVEVLERTNPGLSASYTCLQQGEAA